MAKKPDFVIRLSATDYNTILTALYKEQERLSTGDPKTQALLASALKAVRQPEILTT